MFTSDEIDNHKSDKKQWHHFVRRREAEMAFSFISATLPTSLPFRNALELGAGDGGQSTTIANYCEKLICTDNDAKSHDWLGQTILQRKSPNIEYMICDATDLSRFDNRTFDLVFSSNMLEHIPNLEKCLRECKRVLNDDGIMLFLMPSRWWKFFNLAFAIVQLRRPEIHGVSTSTWREFYVFGAKVWKERISFNGLKVMSIVGMPFYIGHGNSFIPVIKAGNALGLPASFLYVVNKND